MFILYTSWNVDYGHLFQLDIFREGEFHNLKCINCLPYSSPRIENKRQFHGSPGITFHAKLEHSLFKIKLLMIIVGLTRPHHFWFTIPHLENVQMLGKTLLIVGLQPILRIQNVHPWHQAMQTKESVVHVNTVMAKIQQTSKCLKFITRNDELPSMYEV
jgi:hypothetical protein